MSAYEISKMVVFGFMFLLGLVMAVFPKICTKQEFREDPFQVSKIRKSGFIMMGCGLALIVMNILI